MAIFPSIRPTARSYTLGQTPMKVYRGLSGGTVKRIFGNRLFGHAIDLTFENINETKTKQIVDHYNGQFGSSSRFTLPADVFSGMDNSTLRSGLQSPTSIQWEYAEPPSIETIYKGINTVVVRLVGELT